MAFVTVEGEVSRLNRTGHGFGLKESREYQGKERVTYWSVFPKDPAGVSVGDRVKVNGFLDTKVGDPKTGTDGVERRYVDHVVGSAKVEVTQASQQVQSAPQGSNSFDDEQPF